MYFNAIILWPRSQRVSKQLLLVQVKRLSELIRALTSYKVFIINELNSPTHDYVKLCHLNSRLLNCKQNVT